jgi:integrase
MKRRADGRFVKTKTINGKKVFFYSTAKTEKLAERDFENQLLAYKEKEEKGKTFKEVADEWETEHDNEVSAGTAKRYKACTERARDKFGEMYIKDIAVSDINNYIKSFAVKYPTLKTVKMQRSVINLIFKYAMLKCYITNNPCEYVPLPSNLKQTKRELPSDDEIEKVKNGINCTFGLFAYLILYTGLRRGEALALQYKDIDFENKTIYIYKSVYHDSNKPIITKPKTAAGTRNVLLLDCLADKLPKLNKSAFLFPNNEGELLHQSNFNRLWDKYKEESGVTITPHQLRHAYATILYEANVSDKDAQELMGHSNINLTKEIYQHISQKRRAETLDKLNLFVKSSSSQEPSNT